MTTTRAFVLYLICAFFYAGRDHLDMSDQTEIMLAVAASLGLTALIHGDDLSFKICFIFAEGGISLLICDLIYGTLK